MRVTGGRALLAVVGVLGLVAGACGDDDDGNGSGAERPGGSPIKIGLIATMTGPQSSSTRQAGVVGEAWEEWVNEELGGINGHPVEVIVKDDQGDPSRGQAVARELVETDDVLALAGVTDNTIPAWADYMEDQGVAVIGGTSNQQAWYRNTALFPTTTDVLSGVRSQIFVAKDIARKTKFANLYCAEIAACGEAEAVLKPTADAAGIGYTSLSVNSSAPNYTAECLRMRQEGVDYVQLNFASDAGARLVQDCQRQGFNPTFGANIQALGEALFEIDDFTLIGTSFAFNPAADHPKAEEFRNVMDKYADDDDWQVGGGPFAWQGLEVLRLALANAGDNPTRQDVFDGLYALGETDLDGMLPNPVRYTRGQPVELGSRPCYFVVGIEDGKLTAPRDLDRQCPPS